MALIDVEVSMPLRNDNVCSNLNVAGTTTQVLAPTEIVRRLTNVLA